MSAPRLFAGKGIALLQAQQLAGSLAALSAFLACAVSEEFGPVLLALFPAAIIGAHFLGQRFYGKGNWAWTVFLAGALLVLGAQVLLGRLDIVLAMARFVLLLCVHRLWHRRTQRVLTQDAYGRGPVARLLTPLRGRVRAGNSGGPVVDSTGRVLTTVFAGTVGGGPRGGYGVANSTVTAALGTAGARARAGLAVSTESCGTG